MREHECKPASPTTVLNTLATNERLVTDLLENFYKQKQGKPHTGLKSNRFITPQDLNKDKTISNFEPDGSMSLQSPIHNCDLEQTGEVEVHGDFNNNE